MERTAQHPLPQLLAAPRRAPGPWYPTPLHFLARALSDPVGYMRREVERHGDVVRVTAWPLHFHVVAHPDHIKYVLQENNRNYWKGEVVAKMKGLIGEGLFSSEGDFWRRQRRLAQPAFHRERIQAFAALMAEASGAVFDRWQTAADEGRPLDVMEEMSRLTLTIVGRGLFSQDLSGDAAEVGDALLVALDSLAHRILRIYDWPMWVPTPRHRAFKRAAAELDRVVLGIIDERRRCGSDGDDLLAMLMAARDPDTGEGMTDRQLRDEVMTFLLAGHETTAVTLAWAFHLLAQHREIEESVRADVRAAIGDRAPVLADLAALGSVRRVIDETLRLYPAVSSLTRQTHAADEIGGYEIPRDSIVFLSPWVTHRHPAFWEAPDRFDPDRFLPERAAGRPRFAYFPFGGGPRICIGNEFALMEATIALAMALQRYRLEPVPGSRVEPGLRITYRPKGPVWMVPVRV